MQCGCNATLKIGKENYCAVHYGIMIKTLYDRKTRRKNENIIRLYFYKIVAYTCNNC